jgi:DNA-binding NarL/FixJ family response regulator
MKILLADDHALFREGMRYVLQRLFDVVEIIEAGTFQDALVIAESAAELDLILLDLNMPGSEGSKAVYYFKLHCPGVPVVVVSGEESSTNMEKAMRFGAAGFICKSSSSNAMLGALNLVLSGGVYIPPEILCRSNYVPDDKRTVRVHGVELTLRQMEVLQYLCDGKSNKEIAYAIHLAEGTVKVHIAAVYQTLRVNNRLDAVKVAQKMGLLGVVHG